VGTIWTANDVAAAVDAWEKFADASGISNTPLSEYYPHETTSPDGVAKVTREIMRDLVEIGAIVLPHGAKVDGIDPAVAGEWKSAEFWTTNPVLVLTTRNPRAARRKALVTTTPYELLKKSNKLGANNIDYLVAGITRAVNSLYDYDS
jgi:hypothetical protein